MLENSSIAISHNETDYLKDKIEFLKNEILELNTQKDELLKRIDEYNYKYNFEFKDILSEILYLRKENYKKDFTSLKRYYMDLYQEFQKEKDEIALLKDIKAKLSTPVEKIKEIDNAILKHIKNLKKIKIEIEKIEIKKVKQEYVESNSNLNDFTSIFEQEDKSYKHNLSDKEEKEIKSLYKKAAHMCHPDIVCESKKNDAQDIFQELHKAYKHKDIKLIKEIILFLGDGEVFARNRFKINDKESLQKSIDELKIKKSTIEKKIYFIKNEHEFSFIFSLEDEKEYFKDIKSNLLQHLSELKNYKIDPIKNKDEEWVKQLYRYANKYKITNKIIPRDSKLLKKLTKLDLSSKNLLHITSAISNLKSLEMLNFSDNQLLKIPNEFSSLVNLKELNISRNKLEYIPEAVFKIKSLIKLDISKNNLSEIPKDIEENKKLVFLDAGGNFIDNIADEISELKSLKSLSLWGNQLESIPNTLAQLTSLEELKLGSNNLKTLPKDIINLKNLKNLETFMNQNLILTKTQKDWQSSFDDSLFNF